MPAEDCLGCHAEREISKSLEDGDIRSLYVDPGEWELSPHVTVGCTACHGNVDIDSHPEESPQAATDQPPASSPETCRGCHGKEGEEIPVHAVMVAQQDAPPCSQCHSPHRMKRVREWKPATAVSVYCLTCHQKLLRISFASGETLSLTIREAALGASAHLDHQCTDCHADFSKLEHPAKETGSIKDLKAAEYGLCRGCHAEQYEIFEGSLHFKMASYGHPDAPLCTDCHGYHTIAPVKSFELLTGLPCRRCHDDVFQTFAGSAHRARPRVAAHTELPACVSCHRAHESEFTPTRALMNDACLQCHEGVEEKHGLWLPKVATHFESVACTACHAAAAKREFVVRIVETDSGRDVVARGLTGSGTPEPSALLSGADEGNKDLVFWSDIASALGKQHGRTFHLRLELQEGGAAHEIGEWEDAHRKCGSCHERDLQYLDRVFLFRPPKR